MTLKEPTRPRSPSPEPPARDAPAAVNTVEGIELSHAAKGGAGLLADGVADSAQIAELKGRHMGIDIYSSLFDAVSALAP
jgi:hypothetical protein